MGTKEEREKLKYGSYKKIIEAFNIGAGVFYRNDVEILIHRIKDLENKE